MKKLLKYDILNTYKFVAIMAIVSIVVLLVQFILIKTTGTEIELSFIIVFPFLAGLTAWLISRFNDELKNGESILIYCTPNSKTKILLSRLITSVIWVTLAVIMFQLLNIITDYVPFLGVSSMGRENALSHDQINTIRLFSAAWNISYMMTIIVLGMLASVINTSFKDKSFSFILSATIYIIMFLAFHAILMLLVAHFPLNYVLSLQNYVTPEAEHIGNTIFFGSKNGAVFSASYNSATLGIMGVLGNILIFSVLLPVISTLMERKVEI